MGGGGDERRGKKRGRGLNEYSESCACAAAGKDGDSAIIIIPVWHCVSSVSFLSLTLCCNRISSIRGPWHRCPNCPLTVEQESDVFIKHAFLFGCRCQTLCAQHGIAMAHCTLNVNQHLLYPTITLIRVRSLRCLIGVVSPRRRRHYCTRQSGYLTVLPVQRVAQRMSRA